jgi:hypothetical protein
VKATQSRGGLRDDSLFCVVATSICHGNSNVKMSG